MNRFVNRLRRFGHCCLSLVLSCLLVAGCATAKTTTPTLVDLIEKHTAARGGQQAIEAIDRLQSKLRIVEPTYSAEGTWQVDRRGRMRIDVVMGGRRVFTEAYDGERGWQQPADAEHGVLTKPPITAILRHSGQLPTNILGLHEMAGHGHRLDYAGREKIAGVDYHVLVLTLDDGNVTRYYLDPDSCLITRARVRKALHPDNDPTIATIETVWSDFRAVAGVQFAFHETDTDLDSGKLLQTTDVLAMQANPVIDARFYQLP